MIDPIQAEELILKNLPEFGEVKIPLSKALGRVLSKPIFADRPYPPFHRVCMDGFAISSLAWEKGQRGFNVQGLVRAGDPEITLLQQNQAIEVMTGAPCPIGCDIVVRIEDCVILQKNRPSNSDHSITTEVAINEIPLQSGKNIHSLGKDYGKEQKLIDEKTFLRAPEIAILASVGACEVWVYSLPRTAVISTGDELVDIQVNPASHQIRRSNSYQIEAAWKIRHLGKTDVFHIKDNEELLKEELSKILSHYQIILLSGGVSMGKFDFIPQILRELKVKEHFHKIKQRPGKPMWFGTTQQGQVVFGLPGNPVSTAVCLSRYVLPALEQALYLPSQTVKVLTETEISPLPKLHLFLPVKLSNQKGCLLATPKKTQGSGDFSSLTHSDGFVELAASEVPLKKQSLVNFFPW
jgi:molybdopterin molybdotransferase